MSLVIIIMNMVSITAPAKRKQSSNTGILRRLRSDSVCSHVFEDSTDHPATSSPQKDYLSVNKDGYTSEGLCCNTCVNFKSIY